MYKRKKKQKKYIIIVISLITIFLLLFASISLTRSFTIVESGIKDIAMVINKIFMYPFTSLNSDKEKDLSKSYIIQKMLIHH